MNNTEIITNENKHQKEKKSLKIGAMLAMASLSLTGAFATNDSFGDLLGIFTDWLSGNLGKLLALLGFAGTFIVYMMTHKGTVLMVGVIISVIAGGIAGISDTFFSVGQSSFG